MYTMKKPYSFMINLILSAACFQAASATIKGAYYQSWSQDTIPPSSINTNVYTHIYYAFLTPNPNTFAFDNIPQAQTLFLQTFTSTLRSANPPVKTLFSINWDPPVLARMASNPSSRSTFIRSSIEIARTLGFDGIDLDWEYPQTQSEMADFGLLLTEWRAEVRREAAAPLLLTAAVWYRADISWPGQRAYPVGSMAESLDWVNVMNYDYTGSWEPLTTGAHAALRGNSDVSTSYGVGTWVRAGMPEGKMVMGLPLYGKTWRLRDPGAASGIGAAAVGVGPGVNGEMTYADVVRFNEENNATVVYDSATVSVYSVAGSSWIGYDDARSVAVKIDYARGLGLGGYFVWAINGDNNWEISRRASDLWS